MSSPETVPGGWASPEEIHETHLALAARITYYRSLKRAAEQRAAALGAAESCSAEYLETTRRVAERWQGKVGVCEQALALFAGVKHGARIEAMPSPEEEAAQEASYRAPRITVRWTPNDPEEINRFTEQTDEQIAAELGRALSRDVTLEEARNVRATALAMLGPQEVADV